MRFILKTYFKKSRKPHRYATGSLRRFAQKFSFTCQQFGDFSKVLLKIIYKPDYKNAGYYETLKDLRQAYRVFTEKSLIDYIGRR